MSDLHLPQRSKLHAIEEDEAIGKDLEDYIEAGPTQEATQALSSTDKSPTTQHVNNDIASGLHDTTHTLKGAVPDESNVRKTRSQSRAQQLNSASPGSSHDIVAEHQPVSANSNKNHAASSKAEPSKNDSKTKQATSTRSVKTGSSKTSTINKETTSARSAKGGSSKAGPQNKVVTNTESAYIQPKSTTSTIGPRHGEYKVRLYDAGVYTPNVKGGPVCPSIDSLKSELGKSREFHFYETMLMEQIYKWFCKENQHAISEAGLLHRVLLVIQGVDDSDHGHWDADSEAPYMERFADVSAMKPDWVYGEHAGLFKKSVRKDIGHLLLMDKNEKKPAAPNFFLEGKGPLGDQPTLTNQAANAGAAGARAMDALGMYGMETGKSSQEPKALTATFKEGTLAIYAHHIAPQVLEPLKNGYYMTMVDSADMRINVATFQHGLTLYRNSRDWCQRIREALRNQANEHALKAET